MFILSTARALPAARFEGGVGLACFAAGSSSDASDAAGSGGCTSFAA
jgi:hypothetical protein